MHVWSTDRNPGPPSAIGRTVTVSDGRTDRQPSAMADDACTADRVPANLSGQTTTSTRLSLAGHIVAGRARCADRGTIET
jgi:hypothetical protein